MTGRPDQIEAWREVSASAARSTGYRSDRPARRWSGLASIGAMIVALAIVIAGLALRPAASGIGGTGPVTATTDDGMFRLELTTPHATYRPGEAIAPVARVTYLGPDPAVTVSHSHSQLVFQIQEVGGVRAMDGGSRSSCESTNLVKGEPLVVPFGKSGSPDDPAKGFDLAWYRDPTLTLPVGTWRISVNVDFSIGGCGGGSHVLRVSDVVKVVATTGDGPVVDRVEDGMFRFELTTPHRTYAPTDAIEPVATVTFLGPAAEKSIYHGGSIVGWEIEEVGGNRTLSGGMTAVCATSTIRGDTALAFPFTKSGVIGGAFDQAWFDDPVLHLPVGTWRIRAYTTISTDDAPAPSDGSFTCGTQGHGLEVGNVITVAADGRPNEPASPSPATTPTPVPTPSQAGPIHAAVQCGIGQDSCGAAIALVRRDHAAEVDGALEIVVADTCPPQTACDRKYPFDSLVVLVPAPPNSGSPIAYRVVGLGNAPDQLLPFSGPLPAHIAMLVPDPAHQVVEDGTFRLELSTEPKVYGPEDPISPMAALTYPGPDGSVTFGHSDPAVFFTIEEIGGSRQMTGGAADSCSLTTLARGAQSPIPFVKGGGLGFGFEEAWFRDPVLRLPAGTWRITVRFEGSVPACEIGADIHEVRAENVILVR